MRISTLTIHSTAIVDPKAQIDPSVEIGPYCLIEGHVSVSSGCRLLQHVYLTGWTSIGENCVLHPGVIVGHEPQDMKYNGERSYCRIGDNTILREYVTVHRGTIPESQTVIGDNCFLLVGSHVAHNCIVGNNATFVNNVLLAGHVTLEDRVTIGGLAGVHQFVRLGELTMIAGAATVAMDIPPFAVTDRQGRVAGLNRVGMRRAGITRDEASEIREVYRLLYDSGLSLSQAVEQSLALVKSKPGERLVKFLSAKSRRGLAGSSRTKRNRSIDESTSDSW